MEAVEDVRREKRNREPLWYTKVICKRPVLWFGLTLTAHLLFPVITIILVFVDYDILPLVVDAFPTDIKSGITYQRLYAWQHRDDDEDKIQRFTVDDVGPTWKRGRYIDQLITYYRPDDKSSTVFQRQYLLQMNQIEDSLFLSDDYQRIFCQLDEAQKCVRPYSVLRFFDGTYQNLSNVFYDPDYQNIPAVLYEAYSDPFLKDKVLYFFADGFRISPTQAFSNVTRSQIPMGWPLDTNLTDKQNEELLDDFLDTQVRTNLDEKITTVMDGLKLNYFSVRLFEMDVFPQAMGDMMLAIGSFIFIFFFLWIQTLSLWIAGWSVLSIITCFTITNLIYRTVLNFQYFGYFNLMSIFIILGIGADDIFVFYNIWRASSVESYPSLSHRMSDCYRRASGTMFFTSFTTMMAFLVGAISPVLPLSTFGIFTGILIAVNYLSVIFFFPTVLLMYHNHFDARCCCCCCVMKCQRRKTSDATHNVRENSLTAEERHKLKLRKKNPAVRFFAGPYCNFVTHKVIRWIIIIVFSAFIATLSWSASRIEASTEEIKIYRETNNYGMAMSLEGTGFVPSGDDWVQVYLVWGLVPQDFSSCHPTDWKCPGRQEWDTAFHLNTAPAQLQLQAFCDRMRYNLSGEQLDKLKIKTNPRNGELEVDCFMDNLHQYMLQEEDRFAQWFNETLDLSYPLSGLNMDPFMRHYPAIYESNKFDRSFYRYFEVAVSSWLTNSYSMLSNPDYIMYNPLVGEARDPPNTLPARIQYEMTNSTERVGWYGTQLRYATIQVNLSLSSVGLNYVRGLPIRDAWDDFLNEQMSQMEPSLQGGFQVAKQWNWLVVQQALTRGAWMGIGIGLAIAFFVLQLATLNIIVGTLAALMLVCVTACVLGVIPLAGWKIDVMVSMNLTLLVGLSVDYVLHMAEGYHLSEHVSRDGRVRDMLENLGLSVLCGACTTIGAATFMLFSKIQFFYQFGTFLFCIIGFSMAFSLMLFPALLSIIGPEGDTGSLATPLKALHGWVMGRKAEDEDCKQCSGKGFHPPQDDSTSLETTRDFHTNTNSSMSLNGYMYSIEAFEASKVFNGVPPPPDSVVDGSTLLF